jgi:hypothetical protein
MNNYELLISRLDAFIRKYYANKLLRGVLLFLAAIVCYYLVASIGEYLFYLPSWARYLLVALFIGIGGFALIYLILVPLLQMQKLGKVISHHQAAQIIGHHFPNVQDKLLNVLQLKQRMSEVASKDLIVASIDQKTKELSIVPFTSAVNLGKNKKYLPLVLPPLLLLFILLFAAPDIFKESALRFLSPNKTFVPAAPFTFELQTKNLRVPQYDNVEVEMKVSGKKIPTEMSILYNGQEVAMQKKKDGLFAHTFYKVSRDIDFHCSASGFSSEEFTLHTLKKPVIRSFKVFADYPDYTGRKDEVMDNIGDIIAPQGTVLRWTFDTEFTDQLEFILGQGQATPMAKSGSQFSYAKSFMSDTSYAILISNRQILKKDTMRYNVSVIPDQYPSINVQQYSDSLTEDYVLFVGEAGDDYGVRSVTMVYTVHHGNDDGKVSGTPRTGSMVVPIQANASVQFNHFLDIQDLKLSAGDRLSYYFSACDNDAVHGGKCTKSAIFSYEKPTERKLDSLIEKTQEQVTKDLNSATKQNDKIEKDIKQMQEKLLQKNELDWQDKKQMEDMMQRNENLQKQIENIQQKFEQNNKRSEDKQLSDDIKEKQQNMENLLQELKNNQMDERMKKLEELMKMLNKDQMFEKLQQMEKDNALMEKDLDRMLEMMKQLERDMRMEDIAKKAEELAEKQDELNKLTDAGKTSKEELAKKQDALNKEMEELKKDIAEMEKVNEQMENKSDLSEMKKDEKSASENMEKSSSELKGGNSSKASKSQKSAKESLEKLAKKMREEASGGGPDELELDIKAVRQILTNLLRMSFNQEDLIASVKKTSVSDPNYLINSQTQKKLKSDAKMIADSLFALSKKLPKLSSVVNKEIDGINRNMEAAIGHMEQRNIPQASSDQQYVMTGANNLALILNEMLQSLMDQQAQQMQSSSESSGNCKKPGSGNKPGKKPGKGGKGVGMQLDDVITKQKQLGGAMEQLMKKMGQKPGKDGKDGKDGKEGKDGKDGKQGQGKDGKGGKDGEKGNDGEGEMGGGESENMARIAAGQAALRKQLNDLNNQLRKDGKSNPNLTKIQEDMDRNETDIVNKRMTNDLLRRQSEILTRLLEAKESLRQQEQGEQRESNDGKEITREIPQQLKDVLKNRQNVIEYYKTIPPELKPYYRSLVEEYLKEVK